MFPEAEADLEAGGEVYQETEETGQDPGADPEDQGQDPGLGQGQDQEVEEVIGQEVDLQEGVGLQKDIDSMLQVLILLPFILSIDIS